MIHFHFREKFTIFVEIDFVIRKETSDRITVREMFANVE